MAEKITPFKKQLMLDEITFYSICNEEDRNKVLGKEDMTFDDFRRLSLIADYLELTHLHKFIWDMHSHKFTVEMEELYKKCKEKNEDIPEMLMETGHWLDDCWKQAPNPTVAYLLREIFSKGLDTVND